MSEFDVCPCGGEHALACGQFLLSTYRLAEESCDEAHRRALGQHMEECGPCRNSYSLERNIKSLVGRCCGTEVAPESLRSQVQQRIRQMVTLEHSETVVTDGASFIRKTSTTVRMQTRRDPNA